MPSWLRKDFDLIQSRMGIVRRRHKRNEKAKKLLQQSQQDTAPRFGKQRRKWPK